MRDHPLLYEILLCNQEDSDSFAKVFKEGKKRKSHD